MVSSTNKYCSPDERLAAIRANKCRYWQRNRRQLNERARDRYAAQKNLTLPDGRSRAGRAAKANNPIGYYTSQKESLIARNFRRRIYRLDDNLHAKTGGSVFTWVQERITAAYDARADVETALDVLSAACVMPRKILWRADGLEDEILGVLGKGPMIDDLLRGSACRRAKYLEAALVDASIQLSNGNLEKAHLSRSLYYMKQDMSGIEYQ